MKIEIACLEKNAIFAIESGICAGGSYGIQYWCDEVDYPVPATMGDALPVEFREYDEITGAKTWHTLTKRKLSEGLTVLADKYPHAFGRLLDDGQIDGPLGDLLIQCCIFGEEKYG